MNHTHRCALAAVLLLGLSGKLFAAEQVYYLPFNGHLHVNVPDGWKASYEPRHGPWDEPTVRLERAEAVLTFMPLKAEGSVVPADDEVKMLATNAATPYWKRSTDKNLKQEELKAGDVYGVFAHYTLAKPAEGEKPDVSVGIIRLNRVLITTTMFYTANDNASREAMGGIIRGLTIDVATPIRQRTPDNTFDLSIDGRWKAATPVSDWTKKTTTLSAADESRGWQVAVNIEPAQAKPADAGETSDADRARSYFLQGLKVDGAKLSSVNYCSVAEWDFNDEKHALSCYAGDATWISVHFVKPKFDEKTDRATLDELLNGIEAKRTPLPTTPGKKKAPVAKPQPAQPKPAPKDDGLWD